MRKFGEWMPDIPDLENPGLTVAKNVIPAPRSYMSFPSASAISNTQLDKRPQGGASVRDVSNVGVNYKYVGTEDKLYYLEDTTWTDVSGSTYATADQDVWEFAQWDDMLLATNFTNDIQEITLGGAAFSTLAGTPPKARHIAIVGDFVMVGNTFDASDGYVPHRVRWSGFDNKDTWAVSATTQADFEDLDGADGWVRKIVGIGRNAYVFQDKAITRMTYVGSPLIFQRDKLESERGALIGGGVVPIGDNIAYLSHDGFFVFNGQSSIPIGQGKVDDSFFGDVGTTLTYDPTYLDRMRAVHYPTEQVICWSYVSINATGGQNDIILLYNYSPQSETRWSYVAYDHTLLLSSLSQGYTLEGLDAVSTDLDALPFSLDSRVWTGNQDLLGAIDTSFDMVFFNGNAMTATLETGEFQLNPGNRTIINTVRPYVDGTGTVKVQIGQRNLLSESASFGTTLTTNSSGFFHTRNNARYHRARVSIESGFVHAEGIDVVEATKIGTR